MNVAIVKTKAEQALAEGFSGLAKQLPGGADVAEVRRQAIGRFASLGLPHRRIEEWKYTDLRNLLREALPLAVADTTKVTKAALGKALGPFAAIEATRLVFVNGSYRAELSDPGSVAGLEVQPLSADPQAALRGMAAAPRGNGSLDAGTGDGAVLALNTAYMTDGAVVNVAEGAEITNPVFLIFLRGGSEARFVATRNVIRIGKRAKANIVELHLPLPGAPADGQVSTATDVSIGDGAVVSHIKFVADEGKVVHLANWIARLGAAAIYRPFQFTTGTGLTRNEIAVTYKGEGTTLDLSGAFLARGKEHIDTTLVVDHAVPRCESREMFKGVLDDTARGIFQGKIIVRPGAQKTDGKQMAQALMLSPDAEFDSKPELEIYADDVVCGHGSTAAELDEDLLFYCRARGIPLAEARSLMTEAFVGEAIDRVEDERVREAMMARVRTWLARV